MLAGPAGPSSPRHVTTASYGRVTARPGELLQVRLLAAGHVDAPRGTVTGGEVSPAHVPPRRHARRISAVDRLLDWVTRVVALLSWLLRPVKGEQHRTRRPTVGPAGRSLRAVHLFSLQLRPEWTPAGGSLRRWPGPAGPASPRHVTITTYGRWPARAGELLRLRAAGRVDAPRRTGGDVSPAPVPPRRHARRRWTVEPLPDWVMRVAARPSSLLQPVHGICAAGLAAPLLDLRAGSCGRFSSLPCRGVQSGPPLAALYVGGRAPLAPACRVT